MTLWPQELPIFDEHLIPHAWASDTLAQQHYLGPAARGFGWQSEEGVLVLSNPSSRRLPPWRWLELGRWCLTRQRKNDGSRQWALFARWARKHLASITTIVSYSDPGAGHSGGLYRSCGWLWAPTWLRLRPPPSGNGSWGEPADGEGVKDRWVFLLRPDPEREQLLQIRDAAVLRAFPYASFREPQGGDWKRWARETGQAVARAQR